MKEQELGIHDCCNDCAYIVNGCFIGYMVRFCIEMEDGRLMMGNGEEWTQVDFCPFCGVEAEEKIKETMDFEDYLITQMKDISQ